MKDESLLEENHNEQEKLLGPGENLDQFIEAKINDQPPPDMLKHIEDDPSQIQDLKPSEKKPSHEIVEEPQKPEEPEKP